MPILMVQTVTIPVYALIHAVESLALPQMLILTELLISSLGGAANQRQGK